MIINKKGVIHMKPVKMTVIGPNGNWKQIVITSKTHAEVVKRVSPLEKLSVKNKEC